MKKLIAESLDEFNNGFEQPLNEEQLNESIIDQYNKLDKGNEQAIRKFAFELAKKKYVATAGATTDTAFKLMKQLAEKTDVQKLLVFLQKAATDKFAGRTTFAYADPQTKTGRLLAWKNAADLKLSGDEIIKHGT